MANIDFLIHNSTKKILDLVKGLPDREKLESAIRKSSQTSSSSTTKNAKRRFTKHPRHFKDQDGIESTDEDSTITSSMCQQAVQDANKEVVVIKNPSYGSPLLQHNDSSDEYCDVTIRTEEIVDYSVSLSKHLQKHCHQSGHISHRVVAKDSTEQKATTKKEISIKHEKMNKYEKYESLEKLEKVDKCDRFEKTDEDVSYTLDACNNKESLVDSKCERSEMSSDKVELLVFLEPKLKNMIDRSTSVLKECRLIFDIGIEPPDGQEDCERRKKRTFEFASRFSRNYLYQLNRTILEIDHIINPPPIARRNSKSANSLVLGQRFYNAFQTVYLALEAFNKHLPTGIVNGMPEKFRELLEMILKLNTMLRGVSDPEADKDNLIDIFEVYCNSMLLDETLLPQSARESNSNMSLKNKRRASSKNCSSKQESRLSMYQVPVRKDIYWKNDVAALAKKKYQVPSKYKTATFKHRPPPPPVQPAPPPPPLKLNSKKESKFGHSHHDKDIQKRKCKSAKFAVVDMDTNVTTFVQDTDNQMQSMSDNDIAQGDETRHQSRKNLRRHAKGFYHKVTKGEQEMTRGEYECILEHFLEIIGENKLPDGVLKEQETANLLELKFGKSVEKMDFQEFVDNLVECANNRIRAADDENDVRTPDVKKDTKRSTTLSVTGPENAKLICMQDNFQSQSEMSSDLPSQMQQIDPEGHLRRRLSDLTISQQEDDSNELIYKERTDEELPSVEEQLLKPARDHERKKKSKHDSNVPIIPMSLRMLPKNVMLSIIEYKLLYHKEAKKNYMYKKSEDISPWLLVERVADSLLEETLFTITRDIQVDQILKKIYTQEFK